MLTYVWVNWEFNKGAWGQAIAQTCHDHDIEFVAEIMGVSTKTVRNWQKMYDSAYGEYPWPNMANFMRFCNTFNYDPREFFILEEK